MKNLLMLAVAAIMIAGSFSLMMAVPVSGSKTKREIIMIYK